MSSTDIKPDMAVIFRWVETGLYCHGFEIGGRMTDWTDDVDRAMRWDPADPRPDQLTDHPGRTIEEIPADIRKTIDSYRACFAQRSFRPVPIDHGIDLRANVVDSGAQSVLVSDALRRATDAIEKMGQATDLRANVSAFHAATGIKDPDRPCVPADYLVRLRARLLVEELFEILRSLFGADAKPDLTCAECDLMITIRESAITIDLPEFADGLADLMYIAEGGFLAFGIDSRPVHAEVQRANMAKVGGPIRADGKRLKPEGWTPPDIAGIIKRQQEGQ